MAQEREREEIRAFHGSPHAFEKFDIKKVGSGEGAQAYGHGMYFAENRKVAEEYKKALATDIHVDGKPFLIHNRRVGTTGNDYVDDLLSMHDGDLESAIADERRHYDAMVAQGRQSRMESVIPEMERLRGRVETRNTGHVYEVGIDAHPDHFLDWDRPVAEQHPVVQQALQNLWVKAGGTLEGRRSPPFTTGPYGTGEQAHEALTTTLGNQQAASEALRSQGVPGIKYLDQGSRTAGHGSLNYVVFDPSRVTVRKREGPEVADQEQLADPAADETAGAPG